MFDIGWSEMFIIAVLAIVVIGPKQLPQALRTVGFWVRKVRGMARDFQNQLEDVVRESDLEDIKKSVESIGNMDADNPYNDDFDPSGSNDLAFQQTDDAGENRGDSGDGQNSNGQNSNGDSDDKIANIAFDPPEFNTITDAITEAGNGEAAALDQPAQAASEGVEMGIGRREQ